MPSIERKGFLSEDVSAWIRKIRLNHRDFFALADEVNELAQKTMFQLEPHSKHLPELLVASLYIRCLSNYQAVITMLERGMQAEARIVLRALMEALFCIRAIANKPALANDYAREDEQYRLKILRKFSALHAGKLPSGVSEAEVRGIEKEIQTEIETHKIAVRSTEEWAKEADLHGWYLSAYTILSMSVHVKVRDLERYLVRDENEIVREFKWGPDDEDIDSVFVTSIEAILEVISSASMVFKRQLDETLKALHERLEAIVNRSMNS